jgi:hypothetical protein
MKRTVVILCCVLVVQLFTACNETNDGTFTEPITIYEKIGGTWELTKLNLIDEVAAANSLKPDVMNLTTKFNFKTFKINLQVNERFEPTTFEVSGDAPALFLKNGFWKLSNPFPNTDGTAVELELYADEAKTNLVDALKITSLPGNRAVMDFALTRRLNNVPFLTYQYSLKLQ